MVTDTDFRPALEPIRHDAPSGTSARLRLTQRAAVQMLVAPVVGATLFSLWATLVAVSPLTIAAPLLLPVTAAVRRYADRRRREARIVLGRPVPSPYRRTGDDSTRGRIIAALRDPQSWRDAWWLLVHSVLACVTATITVSLFLGGVFYLAYPLLYALTPQSVFGHPFGSLVTLHSTARACVMMPLALVALGLWWALVRPLARLDARFDRSLLGARV